MNENLQELQEKWRNTSLPYLLEYRQKAGLWLSGEARAALDATILAKKAEPKMETPAFNPADNQIEKFLEYSAIRVKDPKVIFDVGCADGKQAMEFAKAFPEAKIYAFECNPECLALAREKIHRFKNINLVEGAVSDKNGSVPFYPVDSSKHWNIGGSSLYKASGHQEFDPLPQTEIKVKAFRLDEWCAKHNISKIDLIWMDLQGAEYLALKGLGALLYKTGAIQLEVAYKEMYAGQALYTEVRDLLEKAGFMLVRNWPATMMFGDAIFINTYVYED